MMVQALDILWFILRNLNLSNLSFGNKKDLAFEITIGEDGTLGPKKGFQEGKNVIDNLINRF